MELRELIDEKRDEILRLAAKHGMRNVRIFGSVARGQARIDSDVDFLVETEPNRSFLDICGLTINLQELLGRRVDVLTDSGLYWLLRRRILKEARPI
jgi:predicted nucleotidyltransferase